MIFESPENIGLIAALFNFSGYFLQSIDLKTMDL